MRERRAAMAPIDAVLLLRRHLAESLGRPLRLEHRVVAEAALGTRRPHDGAVDTAFEELFMAVWPGQDERGYEVGPALLRRRRTAPLQFALDPLHGRAEILADRPIGREQAGGAVERVDADARIVGEGGQPRRLRGGMRLDRRVLGKHVPGLGRSGSPSSPAETASTP